MLSAAIETTDKVIEGRRLRLLSSLARATRAATKDEACAFAAGQLQTFTNDAPFALFYLLDEEAKEAKLVGRSNVPADSRRAP